MVLRASVIPLPTCSAEKKVIFNLFYCLDQAEKKLELGYFEFLIDEIPSAEKSPCLKMCEWQNVMKHPRCRNIPVPKFLCADNSTCSKSSVSKSHHFETSICQNVRSTEWCICWNVPVMKHPSRYDSCCNVPFQNGL